MFWPSCFVYWFLLGTRQCVQTCITPYIPHFEFSYFRPHGVTRRVRAFFQAVLLPPDSRCFWGMFFVIFGVLGICTFVAKNRPEFLGSWVEESNALTRNLQFCRCTVKKQFLKHDFPAPDFECRKSCLNQVGIYGKKWEDQHLRGAIRCNFGCCVRRCRSLQNSLCCLNMRMLRQWRLGLFCVPGCRCRA